MKVIVVVAALAFSQFAAAQKTHNLDGLKRITIGSDIELTLVKANESKIVVSNDEEFEVDYKNGGLALQGDGNATLYYKDDLESMVIGSDSEVKGTDEIKSKSLRVTTGSDTQIALNLNVQDLHVTAGSDSQITLTGKAGVLTATIGSVAQFTAEGLKAGDATVNLGSDAQGSINAKGTVSATVASDASLTIHGNPVKVNESKGSDAEINIVR